MSKSIKTWQVYVIHAFAITLFGIRVPLFPIVRTWSWTYTKVPSGLRVMYRKREHGNWANQFPSKQRVYEYENVDGKKTRVGVKGIHYRSGIKLNSRGVGVARCQQSTHYANKDVSAYWYDADPFWSLSRSWFEPKA